MKAASSELRRDLYNSLSPENRAAIDQARLGREMRRITVEDAAALGTASEFVTAVQNAALKAWPKQRAQEILKAMGEI